MKSTYILPLCGAMMLALPSCETTELLAGIDKLNNIPGVPGIRLPGNADFALRLLRGIAASQAQRREAENRAAYASEQARKKNVRYAAVRVNKEDDGKGDRVMLIDSKTGKPKDSQTYAVKGGASKGEVTKVGNVEATAVDNIQGI